MDKGWCEEGCALRPLYAYISVNNSRVGSMFETTLIALRVFNEFMIQSPCVAKKAARAPNTAATAFCISIYITRVRARSREESTNSDE